MIKCCLHLILSSIKVTSILSVHRKGEGKECERKEYWDI